jgi:hypothetical protein
LFLQGKALDLVEFVRQCSQANEGVSIKISADIKQIKGFTLLKGQSLGKILECEEKFSG